MLGFTLAIIVWTIFSLIMWCRISARKDDYERLDRRLDATVKNIERSRQRLLAYLDLEDAYVQPKCEGSTYICGEFVIRKIQTRQVALTLEEMKVIEDVRSKAAPLAKESNE